MFQKGNKLGSANKGKKKDQAKTIWLLESLKDNGFDYEKMLVRFMEKAAKGDKMAYDMAALLIKMVPHIAQAPKNEQGTTHIDTLVINRYDGKKPEAIGGPVVDTEAVEADPPFDSEAKQSQTPAV